MEILHTTNEEPFVSGTGHFAGWENRLMKLEDTAILFCREGHAHIMIDLQEYELAPNTQVVLLPDTIVNFTNISPDFTISYIAFSRILFQEVTARLDLSFFRFLKENPCVTLPEERTRSINGLASGIEDLYHDRPGQLFPPANPEELYPEFPVGYLRQDSSPVSHETSRRYQPAGRAVQAVYPVGTQALHHPA